MSNLIQAKVKGSPAPIGTVPAFSSRLAPGIHVLNDLRVKVACRYGDVSTVTFESLSDAEKWPGFQRSEG